MTISCHVACLVFQSMFFLIRSTRCAFSMRRRCFWFLGSTWLEHLKFYWESRNFVTRSLRVKRRRTRTAQVDGSREASGMAHSRQPCRGEERRDFLEEGNSVRASIGNERKKLLGSFWLLELQHCAVAMHWPFGIQSALQALHEQIA